MSNNKYQLLADDGHKERLESMPKILEEEDDLEMMGNRPNLKHTKSLAHTSELEHRLHI